MDLPEPPADAADEAPDQGPPKARPPAPRDSPAVPPQSREDTDAGWGERPEPDDDERLYRERPPHWEKRPPHWEK